MDQNRKLLIAFDFDHTIVNDNTDIIVANLLPNDAITPEMKQLPKSTGGWISYMEAIFNQLHKNKFGKTEIIDAIQKMAAVNGMSESIQLLKSIHNFDMIIISDSNSEFIRIWCEKNNLTNCFVEIFTNPAKFNDDNDCLTIKPYTNQTECKMCTRNLCKGNVLQTFLLKQQTDNNIEYDRVFYVGDGRNDMCPIYGLRKQDCGCARIGYYLDKNIEKNMQETNRLLSAQLIRWIDGHDLYKQISEICLIKM